MKWRSISRATKLLSRIFKMLKISRKKIKKMSNFFLFEIVSSKSKFSKNHNICKRAMSHEYVYKISSRYLQKWLRYSTKHVKKRHFSRHFGALPWFSEFCFLTDFDASKSVLGSFFAFFAKIWPKTCIAALNHEIFFVWPFSPGDLRWPWPVLLSQSTGNDTYRCQWHYPCRFIGFVCA